jgi:hypothetical protein
MPKSYSQYKYEDIASLDIELQLKTLFSVISEVKPSDFLLETIRRNTKRFFTTQKAKSEFIIAPILYEFALNNEDKVAFFSGNNFDVDKELGLKGFCDFLFTRSPTSPIIKEPVFCVVEAKNDNLDNGIPHCIAEMYAARLFNERQNRPITVIYGCVTTGYMWLFLRLDKNIVYQDTNTIQLEHLPKILGVLQMIVES